MFLTQGRWDRFFAVLHRIDAEIERLYERSGRDEMRSRFALPLLEIAHGGPATIKDLALSTKQTHSAMSQTIDAMKRAGLVEARVGEDARTRIIHLSSAGKGVVPLVEREWRATEAAVAELDDALSVSLNSIATELEAALASRSAHDRLLAHFEALDEGGTSGT